MNEVEVTSTVEPYKNSLASRRRWGVAFAVFCVLMTLVAVVVLGILLASVYDDGRTFLTPQFLSRHPSVLQPERSGIRSALWGTLWLAGLTTLLSVPVGVGAAVYLEEFARKNRLQRFIHTNISNLAGVPSIVYGILGLAIFVRWMHLGRTILAGALTLSLLALPVIVIASREAIAAVPKSIRLAAFALGATRWQTVRAHVLPAALPGIMTGIILALSRAIGETAPLIMLGALSFVAAVPSGPLDPFTAMPIQIYNWSDQPQPVFHQLAAAGIVVLLVILLSLNAVAVGLRAWQQRKKL